jgi:hypothetical protein
MGRQLMAAFALLATLAGVSCERTDVPERGEELAPGEELGGGANRGVEPVDIQAQRWFREGRTLEFGDRRWVAVNEPIFDPAVAYVGEFEGTPLYAEVNMSPPYSKLFIPLENDYWQVLEQGRGTGPDSLAGIPRGVEGIDPVGDPTDAGGGT